MEKFFNYFDHRYRQNLKMGKATECGPLITISRQTGCDAVALAKKLAQNLNRKYSTNKWHWIDKEILLAAAKELGTGTHRVEQYIKGKELSGFSEMIMAISGDFVSDLKVKKTISDVVLSMCKEGYVILVGRGGVAITGNVKKALHVRLVAPFYWRVDNMMKKRNMDIETAEEFVVDTDEKRYNLILNFLEKKPLNLDYLFDITINRNSFSIDQIAKMLSHIYEDRIHAVMDQSAEKNEDLQSTYG
ncbi:MAG TPA: cytidylate kinase-like family protein [Bacteroidales bacterium]|nr:cytidylate kinase-like family protein [Bacteroidales bacterium]